MVTNGPGDLLGRQVEIAALERLLAEVRRGRSGVLVLRGEPGVGKTALLQHAISSAAGLRVVRAVGIEAEMELPFAVLQQVCAPLLDRLGRIPGPQHEALRVAFGLSAGSAPDRFLVGLAALSLLSTAAEEQPLLCVVEMHSGSITPPPTRWRSWRGGCSPSRSDSCSRRAGRPARSGGCPT
jgi:Cdc6-like AAA superfamily ATPase